ncbi:MAG: thioredoxin domain-containing protein [Patescibacteria group bacterium]
MFCIIALIVFSVLGIFSATHRALAAEAFDCVFRKITFRPCDTGFKEKIKGKLVGKLLDRSAFVARVFNRYFELISWIFFILMLGSTFYVVKGGYNYYLYGSCNGLNQSGFCILDPAGQNNKISEVNAQCSAEKPTEKNLTLSGVNLDLFPTKNVGSEDTIVFIGCYGCDYTRKSHPVIQKLINKKNVNYIFAHYAVKDGTDYLSTLGYCAYQQDKEKFWKFNDTLFSEDKEKLSDRTNTDALISSLGFDTTKIKECVESPQTKMAVEKQSAEIQKTHLYGTPTIFINGEALVGPKPYRVYERMLKNN